MTVRQTEARPLDLADLGKVSVETKAQKRSNSEFDTGQKMEEDF